jgi:hypothetical protein
MQPLLRQVPPRGPDSTTATSAVLDEGVDGLDVLDGEDLEAQLLLQILDGPVLLDVNGVPHLLLPVDRYYETHNRVISQELQLLDALHLRGARGDGVVHHQYPLALLEVAGADDDLVRGHVAVVLLLLPVVHVPLVHPVELVQPLAGQCGEADPLVAGPEDVVKVLQEPLLHEEDDVAREGPLHCGEALPVGEGSQVYEVGGGAPTLEYEGLVGV